ncbi:MAG: phage tail tape measure protein [Roseomonas mucosa]|nr:phage tail tape measure protein [Roseomonas mucosa]
MAVRDMKASLELRLADKLSSGLAALERRIERLLNLVKRLDMSNLGGGDASVGRLEGRIGGVNRRLAETASTAERAAGALRRLGEGAVPRALAAGAMAAPLLLAAPGGGGRLPPGGSAPLLLAGPGGGRPAAGAMPLLAGPGGSSSAGGIPLTGFPGSGARPARNSAPMPGFGELALLGAGAGAALSMPIREAAAFDAKLRDIAITAGATGGEVQAQINRMRTSFERLALENAQSSVDVASAAQSLVAAGLQPEVIDRLLPSIARVATASGASMEELSQTAFQLFKTLKVAPEDMEQAFAFMTQAGKEGSFELKDMARFFPVITNQASVLGLTGKEAVVSLTSMLQIARSGTADASSAANNLNNFLQKISAPDAVKHFKEIGISIEGVIDNAKKLNINPVEAVLETIRRQAGSNPFRIAEIFGDMQVKEFLTPMLQSLKEYQRIRASVGGASTEVVDQDFISRMKGLNAQLGLFAEKVTQLARRAGTAFANTLGPLNRFMDMTMAAITWLDREAPGSVDWMLAATGWTLGLVAALALLGVVTGPLATGFRLLLPLFVRLPILLRLVISPLALLRTGLMWVGGALLAAGAPVAGVIALFAAVAAVIGGAAYLIWSRWERFAPLFSQMWLGIRGAFEGFAAFVLSIFTGDMERGAAALSRMWDGLKVFFGGLWGAIQALFDEFVRWIIGWTGAPVGRAIEAIKAVWGGMTGWFRSLIAEWRAPFDSFIGDIQSRIDGFRNGMIGRAIGLADTPQAEAGRAAAAGTGGRAYAPLTGGAAGGLGNIGGQITVRAEPGTQVTDTRSNNPAVSLQPVNRGATTGRP